MELTEQELKEYGFKRNELKEYGIKGNGHCENCKCRVCKYGE